MVDCLSRVTISIQWAVLPALAASLAAGEGLVLLLARGLGCRLSWKAAAAANALALLVVAPWLVRDRLMVPADETILNNVPGAPAVVDPDRHGLYNDVILQLLPWEMEVRRALRSGHLPLWSDLLDGGSSPWVNPQAGALSPIANLARWAPIAEALLVALALKVLIACQGMWLLARRLAVGRGAAALAAAGGALGGAILPWALFPLSSAVAWIPWAVLAGLLLARRPTPRRIATAAVCLAFLLLSGHPETELAGVLLAAVCCLAWKRRRTPWRRVIAGTATVLILGLGLAAPLLVPFLRILPETQRAVRTLGNEAPARAASAPVASGGARVFLAPANPWAFGRPFQEPYTGPLHWSATGSGYAGLLAFAGVFAVLLAPRCWRRALPLLGFAAASFLLAAELPLVTRAVRLVPFLGAVAFNRFLPVAALALVLAGALGLGELLRQRCSRLAWAGALLAAVLSLTLRRDPLIIVLWAATLGGLLLSVLAAGRGTHSSVGEGLAPSREGGKIPLSPSHPPPTREGASPSPTSRLTRRGVWRGRGARWRTVGWIVLACALLADLLPWGWDFLPTGHRELFYPRTPFVAAATEPALMPGGPWRATAEGFLFYPSLFPVYGVAEVRTHNPVALGSQLAPLERVFAFQPEGRRYKSAFRNVDHPLLDFLNVRLVVSRDNLPPHPAFERIDGGRFPPMRLYLNPGALPRLFLPVAADVRPRSAVLDAVAALRNPRRVVLVAEEVGGWKPPEHRPWDPAVVRVLRWRPGRIAVELPAEGEKLLASSLPFPAGWEARAGGRTLRRLTVDGAYLGVVVPTGVSRVELCFTPPGLIAGLALGLVALAVAIVLLLRR